MRRRELFLNWYETMLEALGPSGWWPAKTPFEVMVGAVLTQNTAWTNVEKAVSNLREANALEPEAMAALPVDELAELIRPAGYYKMKAGRLRNFLAFLEAHCEFDIDALAGQDTYSLREDLLSVKGIGPETADSMLLYALGRPVFVVDAYTARLCHRHGLIGDDFTYDELQALFTDVLDEDPALFNEFHALLVRVGNNWCAARSPKCGKGCPLQRFLD